MSLDDLREDMKRNVAEAKRLTSVQEIRDHLVNTLWPFLEAKIDVLEEMDDAVAELVDQQEDYLQPDTAGLFAAVIQSSMGLAAELRKRATAADAELLKHIGAHEQLCEQAIAVLGEITMVPAEGQDTEDTEDDEEEDGDAEAPENDNE